MLVTPTSAGEAFRATGFPKPALVRWLTKGLSVCKRRGRHYDRVKVLLAEALRAIVDQRTLERALAAPPFPRTRIVRMLMNRSLLIAEGAALASGSAEATRHRDSLLVGALREDVRFVPAVGWIYDSPSVNHFDRGQTPGGILPYLTRSAGTYGSALFYRAVHRYRSEGPVAGYVELGRVLHLAADMCVPVHAHAVPHAEDPYEWFLEGNVDALLALPRPTSCEVRGPAETIRRIAKLTRRSAPNPRFDGVALVREKAQEIVPQGLALAGSIVRDFAQQTGTAHARGGTTS